MGLDTRLILVVMGGHCRFRASNGGVRTALLRVGERQPSDVGLVVVLHAHPSSGHVARRPAFHVRQRNRGKPPKPFHKEKDGVGQLDLGLVEDVSDVIDLDHGGLGLVAVRKHVLRGLSARTLGSGHQKGIASHLVGQQLGDVVPVLEGVDVLRHVLDVDIAAVIAVQTGAQANAVFALCYLLL